MAEPDVTVELFGLARHRAGRAAVEVRGRTIADVLRAVVDECPRLVELVAADGSVSGQFLVSVDGERFVRDTTEVIRRGSRLLILGADAGG
ncbi:MAG TPA: MoaD/ThiS family protein [Gemmataceae bacterium]|nr:MoaD/ThiS family protein [Gemmataceae bacterium]